MTISEFGEIGRLVQHSEAHDMVILWAVHEVRHVLRTAGGTGAVGFAVPQYRTSRGWVEGKTDGSDYFSPRPRERSLNACIKRAVDYAKKNWPNKRAETH